MNAKWFGLMALLVAVFAVLWLGGPRQFLPLVLFIVGMGMLLMHRFQGSVFFAHAARRGTLPGLSEGAAQKMYLAIGAVLVGFALLGTVLR
jgi:hypothetical protein